MTHSQNNAAISWKTYTILLVITLLAAVLRLYHLGSLPAGLHHDEASNGMLALDILSGKFPVFFSDYTGKEAGFMYLVALAIKFFGQTIGAIRLPSALSGVALVPVIFLLTRRMRLGGTVALLAAGITAVSPWLLHISRIGFRANLLPLMLALWAWMLLRALDSNRWRDWASSGLLLGLSAYTYTASRIVPLLVVLFLGYLLLAHRPLLRRCWRGIAVMLVLAIFVAVPLVSHYVQTPSDWSERLEQIGICADLATHACATKIATHTLATIGMIGVRGDPIGFFNLPDSPAIPSIAGWLFYVGVVFAIWRIREPAMALLLIWWGVMVAPGILSQDSPHFLRTIGAAPPTMILWALPFSWRGGKQRTRGKLSHMPDGIMQGIAWALLIVVATISTYDYFERWAKRPELYYDYMGYATDTARMIARVPDDSNTTIFISEEYYRHPTYLYLSPKSVTARWIDARYGLSLVNSDQKSIYFISPATPVDQRVNRFIQGFTGENILNDAGQYVTTRIEGNVVDGSIPAPAFGINGHIGTAEIRGMTVEDTPDSNTLAVTLFWQAREPVERRLRVFLHLVDNAGEMVAQHDVLGYPSTEWRAGDRFVTFHTLQLPTEQLRDDYQIRFGLYDVESEVRLQPLDIEPSLDVDDNAVVVPLGEVVE